MYHVEVFILESSVVFLNKEAFMICGTVLKRHTGFSEDSKYSV